MHAQERDAMPWLSPLSESDPTGTYRLTFEVGANKAASILKTTIQRQKAPMQVSAEIRWFWKNILPPKLKEWFCNAKDNTCAAGGGKPRVDEYLYDPLSDRIGTQT